MHESQKKFKSPPKKYQPRGLSIVYEDHDILVVRNGVKSTIDPYEIKCYML